RSGSHQAPCHPVRRRARHPHPPRRRDSTAAAGFRGARARYRARAPRKQSEEHTSELQSLRHLVCRLLLEKKKKKKKKIKKKEKIKKKKRIKKKKKKHMKNTKQKKSEDNIQ